MTLEQQRQFNTFGCVPRCLIELSKRLGRRITQEHFCELFSKYFREPDTEYGALEPDDVPEIARALSLPSVVGPNAVPTKLVPVEDYDRVALLHRNGTHLLIASQIDLNEGATDPHGHCSVLENIDVDKFTLWTPTQNGRDHVLPFSRQDWLTKQCKGLVFV